MPVCPVPPDQLPINEYQDLRTSWFFRWSMLDLRQYLLRLVGLWSAGWLLAGPLAAASFAPQEFPGRFCLAAAIGAAIPLGLILLRLYLGWAYVHDRLQSQTVVYEETGWYDGSSWVKPPEELAKDRLIGTYQVGPTLKRLRWSLGVLGVLGLGSGLLWYWLG